MVSVRVQRWSRKIWKYTHFKKSELPRRISLFHSKHYITTPSTQLHTRTENIQVYALYGKWIMIKSMFPMKHWHNHTFYLLLKRYIKLAVRAVVNLTLTQRSRQTVRGGMGLISTYFRFSPLRIQHFIYLLFFKWEGREGGELIICNFY